MFLAKDRSAIAFFSLLMISLLSLMSASAFAQGASTLDPSVAKRLRELSAELRLTADQKTKIRPILAAEAPKLKALQDDKSIPPKERATKRRAILNSTRDQIKPLLNPDQIMKLQKIKTDAIKKHA